MLPNGEFAPGLALQKPLVIFPTNLPSDRPKVSAVSIGPQAIGASQGVLTSRYWMVNQVLGGNVLIRGAL